MLVGPRFLLANVSRYFLLFRDGPILFLAPQVPDPAVASGPIFFSLARAREFLIPSLSLYGLRKRKEEDTRGSAKIGQLTTTEPRTAEREEKLDLGANKPNKISTRE